MILVWSLLVDRRPFTLSGGHFPHKFSVASVVKLLIAAKKVKNAKMGWTSYVMKTSFVATVCLMQALDKV